MSLDRIPRPRPGARLLCTALLAAALVTAATPGPAGAWILRYTTGYGLNPNPPLASGPTTFLLNGYYPTGCGSIVSSSVIDPEHVAIHVRTDAACPDSSSAEWVGSFPLGMLAAGNHDLTITLTMERADSTTVESATFTFGVEDSASPPPPPPPPPPAPVPPIVTGWWTDPSPALPTVPVRLTVTGYTPFPCATLSDAAVIDTSHATLTMTATSCSDTLSAWTHTFELGTLPIGHHVLDLAVVQVSDTSTSTVHVPLGYWVADPDMNPPPPQDSLVTVLSPGRPNPFASESRFSVSLESGTHASVAVFDVNGRRVRTVFEGRFESGTTQLSWDGLRQNGSRAPAGLYFYRLVLPGRVISRRVVLLPPR